VLVEVCLVVGEQVVFF